MQTTTETAFRRGERVRVTGGREASHKGRVLYRIPNIPQHAYCVEMERTYKRIRITANGLERVEG